MSKRKKFKFTDLADIESDNTVIEKEKNINFVKKDVEISEDKDFNQEVLNSKINSFNQQESDIKPEFEKKINYEIDYDTYDDNDKDIKNNNENQIFDNNKMELNQLRKTQLKTYSSIVNEDKNEEYLNKGSTFSPRKIKDLISFKERLDVKTNIYLKSSVVVKLKELERRTNESRSSIVNKLLEHALKSMEED